MSLTSAPVTPCSCSDGWKPEGWAYCAECYEGQIERLRANHKDAVETKRHTDARLRWALAGLQRIYNESSDSRMAEIAGEAFEMATSEVSPSDREAP